MRSGTLGQVAGNDVIPSLKGTKNLGVFTDVYVRQHKPQPLRRLTSCQMDFLTPFLKGILLATFRRPHRLPCSMASPGPANSDYTRARVPFEVHRAGSTDTETQEPRRSIRR